MWLLRVAWLPAYSPLIWRWCALFGLLAGLFYTEAFVPQLTPKTYKSGDKVELKVNGLTSVTAQLPYSYYYLPYCRPAVEVSHVGTLGELLMGETLDNSDYNVQLLKPATCSVLCRIELDPAGRSKFKQAIDDEYSAQFLIDDLPALFPLSPSSPNELRTYSTGIPVGWKGFDAAVGKERYFVYNYISIILKYRTDDVSSATANIDSGKVVGNATAVDKDGKIAANNNAGYQIVGFEVMPISFKDSPSLPLENYCKNLKMNRKAQGTTPTDEAYAKRQSVEPDHLLDIDQAKEIVFIYDVNWQLSELKYHERWNAYLQSEQSDLFKSSEIHWISIINALGVVLILYASVGVILIRTLRRDISNYNQLAVDPELAAEESGWKLLHGDVFRKPMHSTILIALAGTGVQIISMMLITLTVAAIGVSLYPTGFGQGRLLQAALLLWSIAGIAGGYTSARFYKLFQSPNWKMTSIRTAVIYPAVAFSIFMVINGFIRFTASSAAASFSAIFMLMLLWFGISTPLIFVGAYFGYKQESIQLPCRVNRIPREIPKQPCTANPIFFCFSGGLLPFAVIFTELSFILGTIWHHRPYMLFGFLLLITIILIWSCAGISIAMTYILLSNEHYGWWWWSFLIPGTSSVFVFFYSIYYLIAKLYITRLVSIVVYIGVSLFMSFTCFILTGTCGFIASFWFVRTIYGSIKVD